MTTLAKIEANQRNAQHSTGPRTAGGKALVARNATTHGIFSAVPVLPGEDAEVWEAHRRGVVDSLAPVGLLEVNLAERAALLLWRLQRLARYEAETVAAAMEDVNVPALTPAEDDFDSPSPRKDQRRGDQLKGIRRELRNAQQELAEVAPARDYFRSPPELESRAPLPFEVAESIFVAALRCAEAAEELRSDPPAFEDRAFLRKLGLSRTAPKAVSWTPELIERGLAVYAAYTKESPQRFREAVRFEVEDWAEELERKLRRLGAEADAVAQLLDSGTARKRAAKLLPGDGRDQRIAKYERHLHNLFTSTLHELERLQARRGGETVAPPAVADVNVSTDAGLV